MQLDGSANQVGSERTKILQTIIRFKKLPLSASSRAGLRSATDLEMIQTPARILGSSGRSLSLRTELNKVFVPLPAVERCSILPKNGRTAIAVGG